MSEDQSRRVLIVYELGQVEAAADFLAAASEPYTVVALNFWAERELAKRGITYRSLTEFESTEEEIGKLFDMTETFARQWYRLPELAFFKYKDVRIGEAVEPAVDNYVQRVLYFMPIIRTILDRLEPTELVIPHMTQQVSALAGSLDFFEYRAPADVARYLCLARGCTLKTLGEEPIFAPSREQPAWRHYALSVLNWVVAHTTKKRPLKIFASEYWRNIEPFIPLMNDAEIVLMDRSEIRNIPLRQIFARRMRFIHPHDVMTPEMRAIASEQARVFKEKWSRAEPVLSRYVESLSPDFNWWPIVAEGFRHIVDVYAERVVADAEGIEHILKSEGINRVLLRASVSGRQHHFFTTTRIARSLGIPSVELQHAGEMIDPRSVHSRLETDYLAAYGPLSRRIGVRNHGYAPERIRPVGTPRFDRYLKNQRPTKTARDESVRSLGLDPQVPVLLAAVPPDTTVGLTLAPFRSTAHDLAAFFRSMRALRDALPDLQIIFKFRPLGCKEHHRAYIRELFPDATGIALTDGDLFSMLVISDIASSGNSTALIEAMISKTPLVLFPWRRENTYDVEIFEKGAPMTFSVQEFIAATQRLLADGGFKEETLKCEERFLAENYSFDGHSAERIIELLREDLEVF